MDALPLPLLCSLPGVWRANLTEATSVSLDESTKHGCLRTDTRLCVEGDLFVALKGDTVDAHNFVPEMLGRGLTCVVDRSWFLVQDASLREHAGLIVVEHTRDWLPRAVCRLARLEQAELHVHGVTGTNGKSSTCWILQHLLLGLDPQSTLIGTLGAKIGAEEIRPTAYTTPEASWLGRIGSELLSRGGQQVAMEVSSHAIQQQREAIFSYDSVVFLNLSPEHLDYHGDMEQYFRVKASFMRRPEAKLRLVNIDDPWGQKLVDELSILPVTRFGQKGNADWRIENVQQQGEGQVFRLAGKAEAQDFWLPMTGQYNVSNACAALLVAHAEGMSLETLAGRLRTLPPVPGRLEPVPLQDGPRVLIDYAHSPDGYSKVLEAVKPIVGDGHLHVLFGCGGDRDRDKRPVMTRIASREADKVWLCPDNPRSESQEQIFGDMLAGLVEGCNHVVLQDREEAIQLALRDCTTRDTLLLLGKGHERYQLVGQDKCFIDEAAIVRKTWADMLREGK